MSFDGYGNVDNMAPMSRVQREREAELIQQERRDAARFITRIADREQWSEQDREDVLGGLGLLGL